MSSPQAGGDTRSDAAKGTSQPIRYPVDHVIAVVDQPEQLRSALAALKSGGFLESELGVRSGEAMADALAATSGRTGWSDLAMRFSDWMGLTNDEMEIRHRYEDALRDGHFVVSVAAATDERRDVAARVLLDHGAHFVNFLGRYTMVLLAR